MNFLSFEAVKKKEILKNKLHISLNARETQIDEINIEREPCSVGV